MKTRRFIYWILAIGCCSGAFAQASPATDLEKGKAALVEAASFAGPNGILVVDLASGSVRRRLAGHASVIADQALRLWPNQSPARVPGPGNGVRQAGNNG